jgi:hypothetical protein
MVISAIADGDVVRVPKSLTDLTPRILSRNGSLGTFFGGAEAAKAKGSVDLRMSEKESESKIVSTVFRVPPLGPELFISSIAPVTSFVSQERSSRTRLTTDQAKMSAGALSTPTDGII